MRMQVVDREEVEKKAPPKSRSMKSPPVLVFTLSFLYTPSTKGGKTPLRPLTEPTLLLSPASMRIPLEILLAIIRRCSPSALAAFAQCSLACLEIISPLLYNYVVLKDVLSSTMFFSAPVSQTLFGRSRRLGAEVWK